jgi:TetR/AcrR family transcriptional regulator, lmrAB and yxaGH operons repressor
MSKGEATRAKMIATTAELLQKQGYHATGLAQVLADSGAPRGSLYFHFPGGKEELACAAIIASGDAWRARLALVVADAKDAGAAIEASCDALAAALVESDFEIGCPIATVALEAASTSEPVRQACVEHFGTWRRVVAQRLRAEGMTAAQAERQATFVLAAVEGAMMLAKIERDPTPLRVVGKSLRAMIAAR